MLRRPPRSTRTDHLFPDTTPVRSMIGWLEAARHFAHERGASFETEAGIRIRGAMLDELRRTDWTPRSVHRKTREVAEVIRQIETETGAEADDAEVIRRLGISAEEYHQVLADAACEIGRASGRERV